MGRGRAMNGERRVQPETSRLLRGRQRVWSLRRLTCTNTKIATPHLIAPVIICRVLARKLISIVRQPVPVAASRCYLIQMLRWAMTCIKGCSCWSPAEENSPGIFLTMDALYRLS
jgi:hypothetical protein